MRHSKVTRYLITFSMFALPMQSSYAASECSRINLSGTLPQWISSAAYLTALNKIGVVDALRNKVLLLDAQGQSGAYDGNDLAVPKAAMTPAIVNSTREGFEVSMVDQQLYWYDGNLKPLSSQNLTKSSAGSRGKVMGTYDSILAGDHFFSVGAVKWNGKLRLGFFVVPIASPSNFMLVGEIPDTDFYILGHQYITTLNGSDYAVLMSKHPVILEFPRNGKAKTLDVFSANTKYNTKYDVTKLKTEAIGPSSDEPMYREIEGLSIPAGLYGAKDGFLYLLTREPDGGGRTTWRLFQIAPKNGAIVGEPMTLPTSANHLTVVVGPRSWYFIEKGAVLPPAGNQEIRSMLEVSSSAITNHAVPAQCPSR